MLASSDWTLKHVRVVGGESGILIVDDDPRILESVCRLVSRRGFVSMPFARLGDAMTALTSSDAVPAAAIIDVFLERGRQGYELVDLIRERYGPGVPLMMITGYLPGELRRPYRLATEEPDGSSDLQQERVPVHEKPVDCGALHAFLVRAAISERLRRGPVFLRERVIAFALQNELTAQEARVLAYLATGSTRASLPSDLVLSKDTVKSQIATLLGKCGVNATDELSATLLRVISDPESS